ncbi:hypothetical protein KY362_03455 [Candidatus Woesearchaeota archaeon]|nr:hypothetical protein [Candidatus Woesearchaeota archaeon]
MLDKKDLDSIRKSIDLYDKQRDVQIKASREVVKLSKQVIYAVHRDDMKSASKSLTEMKNGFAALKAAAKHPKLMTSGSYKVAVQEFVEALSFFELSNGRHVPPNTKLKLDPEYYLMGLIDLTGELVRKAINSSINGDYATSVKLKGLVSELYDQLMLFNFSGGELRKKFDSVKYDLKKLDDLVLSLKMNNKI